MPVNDAKRFIHTITRNQEFMNCLNICKNNGEIKAALENKGFKFDSAEFVEAWTNKVANSQTREEHEQFNQLRMWWEMLNRL